MKKHKQAVYLALVLLMSTSYGYSQINALDTKSLYVLSVSNTLNRNNDINTAFEINYFNAIYSPGMTSQEAIDQMTKFRTMIQHATDKTPPHTKYEYGMAMLDLGIGVSKLDASFIKAAFSFGKLAYDDYSKTSINDAFHTSSGINNFNTLFQNRIVEYAYDKAAKDANYRQLLDLQFGQKLGHSTTETAEQILAEDQVLSKSALFQGVLTQVKDIQAQTLSDLEKDTRMQNLFAAVLDSIKGIAEENNALLKTLVQNQQDFADKATQQQRIEYENAVRLEAAGSAVNILSKTAALLFPDSKLSGYIGTFGNAAISIASSISKFNEISAKFSDNSGSFMGSIILSGNIFNAATSILGLFASSSPSPDEIIMQQLKGISQQIDTMYACMNRRFDDIDTKLETIYETINRGFSQIDTRLDQLQISQNHITAIVLDIKNQLNDLSSELDKDAYNTEVADLQKTIEVINLNAPIPSQLRKSAFQDAVVTLHLYGNQRDVEWANRQNNYNAAIGEDQNNQNIFKTLNASAVDQPPFDLLHTILANRPGLSPYFGADTLPDAGIWLVASNGLLKLANTWPKYASSNIIASDIKDLIDKGKLLSDFQKKLRQNFAAADSEPSYLVLDSVLENYRAHCLGFIQQYIVSLEQKFIAEKAKGLNPFYWRRAIDSVPFGNPCFAVSATFPEDPSSNKNISDSSFFYKLIPNQYKLANFMGFESSIRFEITNKQGPSGSKVVIGDPIYIGKNRTEPIGKGKKNKGFSNDTLLVKAIASFNNTAAGNTFIKIPWHNYWTRGNEYGDALDSIQLYYKCNNDCMQVPADKLCLRTTIPLIDSVNKSHFTALQHDMYTSVFSQIAQNASDFTLASPGGLDYYYTLLKDITTVAFPRSMTQDDSLVSFFYGKNSLLNSANIKGRLLATIDDIKRGDTTDFYIPWITAVNSTVDGLKSYLHQRLTFEAANKDEESLIPVDFTLANLKLLLQQTGPAH